MLLSQLLNSSQNQELNESVEYAEPGDVPVAAGVGGSISHQHEGTSC